MTRLAKAAQTKHGSDTPYCEHEQLLPHVLLAFRWQDRNLVLKYELQFAELVVL